MSDYRKKLVAVLSVAVAILAVGLMAAISGVPLAKSVLAAVHDPNPNSLGLFINSLAVTLWGTLGVFMVARWSALTDEMKAMRGDLEATRRFFMDKAGVQIVRDNAHLWAGMVIRLISDNATLLSETNIQKVAGGRYRISVDEARVANFMERLTKKMTLIYVFYVPRNVVGESPATSLLRLVHLVRVCRARANAKGMRLAATVRVIIVNSPRPSGSVFIGTQIINDALQPFAREYYRDSNPVVRSNTPTADRMFLQHHDKDEIEALEALVKKAASRGVELEFQELERMLGILLPAREGGTAPIIGSASWNRVVRELYRGAEAASYTSAASEDHLSFPKILPSLDSSPFGSSNVADPPANETQADQGPI